VALLSLLATQFIVDGLEIHRVGFRRWLSESMRHSFIGYVGRYSRRDWARFAVIFVLVFAASTVIWELT
jgi:hypothetical protein